MGHIVLEAENGAEAIRICRLFNFNLMILDYHIPDMNGLKVVATLGDRKPPFIFHSSDYDNQQIKEDAINAKALGVIKKIGDIKSFKQDIQNFLKQNKKAD